MVGHVARKRSVAGCQGWKHTEPCLKPGRAPSTGAERGWVKGYKKGGWPIKKRRHADTSRRADCADHYKSSVCVGQKVACHCEVKGEKKPAKLSHLEAAEKVSFVSCGCHKPDWI